MRGFKTFLAILLSMSLTMSFCVADGVNAKKKSSLLKSAKSTTQSSKKSKKAKATNKTTKKVTLGVGEKSKISVAKAKKYKWTSSNNSVVSVKKGVLNAKSQGSAEVTGKLGKKQVCLKVTVAGVKVSGLSIKAEDSDDVDASGAVVLYYLEDDEEFEDADDVEIEDDADEEDDEDEEFDEEDDEEFGDYTFSASFTAKVNGKKISKSKAIKMLGIKWASSNQNVVTIDANGNIGIVGKGTSEVSVKIGGKTAKIKVVITDEVEEVDEDDDDDEEYDD